MQLAISPQARDHILAKGGVVHLESHQGMSLC